MAARRSVAMIVATLIAAPLTPVAPAHALQGGVAVSHDPVSCVIADEVIQLEASVPPGATAARARVYFHSALGSEFFYVEGVRTGERFVFNLPRPRIDAGPITYYVEFQPEGRTAEYTARVVRGTAECDGRLAAIGPAPAAVFGPGGAIVASPAGFGVAGAAGAGSFGAAAAGGSVAAAGGGISAGLLIAGAAVLAGAAVAIAVTSGDDDVVSPSR